VAVHPTVEAAHGGECPRGRPFGDAATGELGEKAAHRESVDALPGPGALAVVAGEEAGELAQVARVGDDGVRRDVAFLGEVLDEVGDLAGEGRLDGLG